MAVGSAGCGKSARPVRRGAGTSPRLLYLHCALAFDFRFLRTDEHGAITVRLDAKGGMEVETYRGEERKGAKGQRRKGGE